MKVQMTLLAVLEYILVGLKNGRIEAAQKLLEDLIADTKARGDVDEHANSKEQPE